MWQHCLIAWRFPKHSMWQTSIHTILQRSLCILIFSQTRGRFFLKWGRLMWGRQHTAFWRLGIRHGRVSQTTRLCAAMMVMTRLCSSGGSFLLYIWCATWPCLFLTRPYLCVIVFWSIFLCFEVGFHFFFLFSGILIRDLIEKDQNTFFKYLFCYF